MSPQIIQVAAQFFTSLATTNTLNVTMTSPPAQGNSIVVVIMPPLTGAAPSLVGVSDNQSGNNFSLLAGTLNDYGSNGAAMEWCPAIGAVSGSYTVSLAINFTNAGKQVRIVVLEVSNLTGSDQAVSAALGAVTSFQITAPAPNLNPVEFVIAAMVTEYDNGVQWSHPPLTGYTDADSFRSPGRHDFNVAYKLTSGIETSSATWSTTAAAGNTVWGVISTFTIAYAGSLASDANQVSGAESSLTTHIALASASKSVNAASSVIGLPLFSHASASSHGSSRFTTAAAFASQSRSTSKSQATSTTWASVVLAAPLYTGRGSIVNAAWTNGIPGVGTTVYYDPTNLTILTDGETVGTADSFSAVAQWLPGAGSVSWADIVFSPFVSASPSVWEGISGSPGVSNPIASFSLSKSTGHASIRGGAGLASRAISVGRAIAPLTTRVAFGSHSGEANSGRLSLLSSIALASRSGSSCSGRSAVSTRLSLASHSGAVESCGGIPSTRPALASTSRSVTSVRGTVKGANALVSRCSGISAGISRLSAPKTLESGSRATCSSRSGLGSGASLFSRSTSRALCDPELTTRITPVSSSSSSCGSSLLVPVLVRFDHAVVSVEPQLVGPEAPPGPEVSIVEQSTCFVTAKWFDAEDNPYVPLSVSYRVDDVTSGTEVMGWRALPPSSQVTVTVTSAENTMLNATVPSEERQVLFEITDQLGERFNERVVYSLLRVPGL